MSEETETKDMRFTPELQEKLRGFLVFSKESTFKYVPKVFREHAPKDLWPVFILRGKDGVESAKVEDDAGWVDPATKAIHFTLGSQRLNLLASNIAGWSNLFDASDNEIKFEKNSNKKVSEKCLRRFPSDLQIELQNAIIEQSRLSEEELQGLES